MGRMGVKTPKKHPPVSNITQCVNSKVRRGATYRYGVLINDATLPVLSDPYPLIWGVVTHGFCRFGNKYTT